MPGLRLVVWGHLGELGVVRSTRGFKTTERPQDSEFFLMTGRVLQAAVPIEKLTPDSLASAITSALADKKLGVRAKEVSPLNIKPKPETKPETLDRNPKPSIQPEACGTRPRGWRP